jgi:hypothetical protein
VLPVSEPARQPAPPPTDERVGNAFLDNLSVYQPIYAVYGPGTDARLQISFKYKLFGSSAVGKGPADWRQGLHFAYTQRMLWDLSAASSPFHNIDFQPELIYITPSFVLNNGIALGGQVGLRHDRMAATAPPRAASTASIWRPWPRFPGQRLPDDRLAARLGLYRRQVRQPGHHPLSRQCRAVLGNRQGRRPAPVDHGAAQLRHGQGRVQRRRVLSPPRLLGGGPDFYLYLQTFTGYGENLLDYNRYTSRVRIGLALVR